jgi:hypothetical protein
MCIIRILHWRAIVLSFHETQLINFNPLPANVENMVSSE